MAMQRFCCWLDPVGRDVTIASLDSHIGGSLRLVANQQGYLFAQIYMSAYAYVNPLRTLCTCEECARPPVWPYLEFSCLLGLYWSIIAETHLIFFLIIEVFYSYIDCFEVLKIDF
jgi:hypothetical protein